MQLSDKGEFPIHIQQNLKTLSKIFKYMQKHPQGLGCVFKKKTKKTLKERKKMVTSPFQRFLNTLKETGRARQRPSKDLYKNLK